MAGRSGGGMTVAFLFSPLHSGGASCWQQASRQGEGGATDSESSLELWLFHFFFFELNYNCFTCCVSFCCAMK